MTVPNPLTTVPGTQVSPAVEPIKVLAMALQSELALADGQIMLGLENWKIPGNTGLYVAIFYGPEQIVGNNNYNATDADGNYYEVQSAIMLHQIEVDIMSFDSSARLQKEAVLWTIQSSAAQQLMEKYQMRLARMPGAFVPVQSLEETKQLNRFRLTIAVNAVHTNVKTTSYFDSLQPVALTVQP
jgi:hypothetical protein